MHALAGCENLVWIDFIYAYVNGGKNLGTQSLADCKSACVSDSSCQGVDYRLSTSECALIPTSNKNRMTSDSDAHYYRLRRGKFLVILALLTFQAYRVTMHIATRQLMLLFAVTTNYYTNYLHWI